MQKSDDPHENSRRMKEFGLALPTSRHVEVLFDSIVDLLGDDVWLAERRAQRTVYRRDPSNPELLIPWPLLRFALGEHLAKRGAMQLEGGESWEPVDPVEPIAPPSNLRGLQEAELVIGGGASLTLAYNGQGRLFEMVSSANGPDGEADALLEELLAAKQAERGVEGLAECIARIDPGTRGPGRVRVPARIGSTPDTIWACGLRAMKRALWDRQVPHDDCWLVADGIAGTVGCGATTDAVGSSILGE